MLGLTGRQQAAWPQSGSRLHAVQGAAKSFVCHFVEGAEGKIRIAAGIFGCAARNFRTAASDFVPAACKIGSAACVFGTAEEKIGTAEQVFGTAEGFAGWAAVKIRTAEESFGQRAMAVSVKKAAGTEDQDRGSHRLCEPPWQWV